MLFRLPEYDAAAKLVAFTAIDEMAMVHAPSLRLFPRRPVAVVPTARVDLGEDNVLRIPPTSHSVEGRFDVREVVEGRFADLMTVLDQAAQRTARARVAYMQQTLDAVTGATGNVVRGAPSWETLMTMLDAMPIAFDDDDQPTFQIVAGPNAAADLNNLPVMTAVQRAAWDDLMERKRDEFRARQRRRRLS